MKAAVSVRQRGGRWQIRIRAAGRKEITESLPAELPEDAVEAKAAKYRYRIGIEDWDPWYDRELRVIEQLTVRQAVDFYLQYIEDSPNHTPNSKRTATYRMKSVAAKIGALQMNEIRARHLSALVDGSGKSAATRKSFGSGLRAFLNWSKGQGYIDEVPKIRLPKPSRKTRQEISEEELRDVVAACLRRYAAYPDKCANYRTYANLWIVQFHTGLRNSELLGLRVRDWLPSGRFQVGSADRDTKTHSDRWVPVPAAAVEIVESFARGKAPADLLFGNVNAERYSKVFKKFLKAALPQRADVLNVYSLRHSYAIRLLNAKIDGRRAYTDYEVANLLGHSMDTLHSNYAEFSFDRMMDDFHDRYEAMSTRTLRLVARGEEP